LAIITSDPDAGANGLRGRVFSTICGLSLRPCSLLTGWLAQTWGFHALAGLWDHYPGNLEHAFFDSGYPQIGGLTQDERLGSQLEGLFTPCYDAQSTEKLTE
jgi:hypothetical protein